MCQVRTLHDLARSAEDKTIVLLDETEVSCEIIIMSRGCVKLLALQLGHWPIG